MREREREMSSAIGCSTIIHSGAYEEESSGGVSWVACRGQ